MWIHMTLSRLQAWKNQANLEQGDGTWLPFCINGYIGEIMGEEMKTYLDDRISLGKSELVSTPDSCRDGEHGVL